MCVLGYDKSEISAAGARFTERNHYCCSIELWQLYNKETKYWARKKNRIMKSIEINPFAWLESLNEDGWKRFMRDSKNVELSNIKRSFTGLEALVIYKGLMKFTFLLVFHFFRHNFVQVSSEAIQGAKIDGDAVKKVAKFFPVKSTWKQALNQFEIFSCLFSHFLEPREHFFDNIIQWLSFGENIRCMYE